MVRRIDDEDLPEIGGEILVFAQIIEHVADGPMFGHRDQIALHQAAGGLFRVAQRLLDRGAIVGLHRTEHGTHPIVHLGEHVAVEQLGERGGKRAAGLGRSKLEQVGDIGRVERSDEQPRAFDVPALDPIDHGIDEFRS